MHRGWTFQINVRETGEINVRESGDKRGYGARWAGGGSVAGISHSIGVLPPKITAAKLDLKRGAMFLHIVSNNLLISWSLPGIHHRPRLLKPVVLKER